MNKKKMIAQNVAKFRNFTKSKRKAFKQKFGLANT